MKRCNYCNEKYDIQLLERFLGPFSKVLNSGCCSSRCYNNDHLPDLDSTIDSEYLSKQPLKI